jgi:uncharacterized alpha-E superfamily protein
MSRGEGSNYLKLGRFLERAIQTTDIIRVKLSEMNNELNVAEEPTLRYLLYSLFGYEQYIKSYKGSIRPEYIFEFVLTDIDFPHSIVYSLHQMSRYFGRLQNESLQENFEEIEYLIGKTMNKVRYNSMQSGNGQSVTNFLMDVRKELFEIASALGTKYFGYT